MGQICHNRYIQGAQEDTNLQFLVLFVKIGRVVDTGQRSKVMGFKPLKTQLRLNLRTDFHSFDVCMFILVV